jgi:PAS domain S-box-containing protein
MSDLNKAMTNQQLFSANLDLMPFACLVISDQFLIVDLNTFLMNMLSIQERSEVIGNPAQDIVSSDQKTEFLDFLSASHLENDENQWKVFTVVGLDQTTHPLLMNGSFSSQQRGNDRAYFIFGLPTRLLNIDKKSNISAREQDFNGLKTNKYEYFFHNATIGIAVLTKEGVVEEANLTFLEHTGAEISGISGKHFSEIFYDQAKEKLSRLTQMLGRTNPPFVKDVVAVKGQGENHRIIEVSLSEFYDEYEHSNKLMLFTEDITHQQDTHAALLQSEKLALTGRLAASLAHEINNPLQTSLGCLGLVEEMLDEDDQDLAVYINMAMEELQRSARIVKKLRDLNRTSDLSERSLIDLREIIDGVLVLTRNHFYDRDIVPVFPYNGAPPIIMASRDQIQQVVLNLVMNAIDELPNGGNIYFDIIPTDEPQGIRLHIRDTGSGIDPEIEHNIFDPFFTTKDDGIGLGLYICKQIIEDHGGTLQFTSEVGQGTEFSLWLPSLDASAHKEE